MKNKEQPKKLCAFYVCNVDAEKERLLREHAISQGYTVTPKFVYRDHRIIGTRPELGKMLAQMEQAEWEKVFFWSVELLFEWPASVENAIRTLYKMESFGKHYESIREPVIITELHQASKIPRNLVIEALAEVMQAFDLLTAANVAKTKPDVQEVQRAK